jgi:hypothetical protein
VFVSLTHLLDSLSLSFDPTSRPYALSDACIFRSNVSGFVLVSFSAVDRDTEKLRCFKSQNSNSNKKFIAKTILRSRHGSQVLVLFLFVKGHLQVLV